MKRILALLFVLFAIGSARVDAAVICAGPGQSGCATNFNTLQAAINAAVATTNDVIILQMGAVFNEDISLPVKSGADATHQIYIRSGVTSTGTFEPTSSYPVANLRPCPSTYNVDWMNCSALLGSQNMAKFATIKPATNNAYAVRTAATGSGTPVSYYNFQWVEFRANSFGGNSLIGILNDTASFPAGDSGDLPHHFVFEQCVVRGDPVSGQFRGFQIDGNDVLIENSFIYDIKALTEGQAIWFNGTTSGPNIYNNYVSGGTEVIFSGGSGSQPDPMYTVQSGATTTSVPLDRVTDLYVGKGIAFYEGLKTVSSIAAPAAQTITTSSVANPTVITVPSGHGMETGDYVTIAGHTGSTPAIGGVYYITKISSTQYSIAVNVTVAGSGGTSSAYKTIVTTGSAHNLGSGWEIVFASPTGCVNNQLVYIVTVLTTTTFSLKDTTSGGDTNCASGGTAASFRVRAHAEVTAIASNTVTVTPALPLAPAASDEVWSSLVPDGANIKWNVMTRPIAGLTTPVIATPTGATATASTASGSLAAGSYAYRVEAMVLTAQAIYANSGAAAQTTTAVLGSTGHVTISWSAVANTSKYRIYGRTPSGQDRYWEVTAPTVTFDDTGTAGTLSAVNTTASYWQVKNTFELKNCLNCTVQYNIIENSWGAPLPGAGQAGYLVLFTATQQGIAGHSAVIRNVNFSYNIARHGNAAWQFSGRDALGHESSRSGGLTLAHDLFYDVGGGGMYGATNTSGWSFTGGGGPRQYPQRQSFDVSVNHLTVWPSSAGGYSYLMFGGCEDYPPETTPSHESTLDNFDLTNTIVAGEFASISPAAKNCGVGTTPGRITSPTGPLGVGSAVSTNILAGGNCAYYTTSATAMSCPSTATMLASHFTSATPTVPTDFVIKPGSIYKAGGASQALDGTDMGADISAILAGTTIAETGDHTAGGGGGGGGGSSQGPTLIGGVCPAYGGAGSPEGAITAPVCSLYLRSDGGAGTAIYIKESGTGNTGWVAVGSGGGGGSGNGYVMRFAATENINPWPDSTTYLIGNPIAGYPAYLTTAYDIGKIIVPKTGTVKAVTWEVHADGSAPTSEAVTISLRVNNTTDNTISTTADWSGAATTATGLVSGLSIAVTAGDSMIIKIASPVWATNPTFVTLRGYIYIE
jgi:hypothetical protein